MRGNKGASAAGVDGSTASSIALWVGVEKFLDMLRSQIKDRSFQPMPVRERMIPKAGGKLRRLGIATITDRVVQASLKLARFGEAAPGKRTGRKTGTAPRADFTPAIGCAFRYSPV